MTDQPTTPDLDAEDDDREPADDREPCGEYPSCRCHCSADHVCGCDCWRCDTCRQNEDHCQCNDLDED